MRVKKSLKLPIKLSPADSPRAGACSVKLQSGLQGLPNTTAFRWRPDPPRFASGAVRATEVRMSPTNLRISGRQLHHDELPNEWDDSSSKLTQTLSIKLLAQYNNSRKQTANNIKHIHRINMNSKVHHGRKLPHSNVGTITSARTIGNGQLKCKQTDTHDEDII